MPLVADECHMQPLQVERLPNLHVARTGHEVFCENGEVLVVGGHTSGFVPTATAEYFADGQWHLLPTVYTHDQGLGIQLKLGEIIVAGGHEQPLGIGQTFTLERYNPAKHTFEGYGCLELKRCFAQALEMDSGRVIISGNWYADDAIELFDGSRQCHYVKNVTQHRALPYLLRTAKDNAIIFGSKDHHGNPFDSIIIDRLRGEPFTDSLLTIWRPYHNGTSLHPSDAFIGDEAKEYYAYLLKVVNDSGQVAIAKVEGEAFALLPTATPIPMQSQWGPLAYFGYPVVDRDKKAVYLMASGSETDRRLYVLRIDYTTAPSPLTLYYTEPQDSIAMWQPVLTPDGNLVMAGGQTDSNFTPSARALLLRLGGAPPAASAVGAYPRVRPWLVVLLAAVALAALAIRYYKKRRSRLQPVAKKGEQQAGDNEKLMQRICQLMEKEQFYLRNNLKLQDVADALGTNRTYVSDCIKASQYGSFNQLINTYRVNHAMQLLNRQPDLRSVEVSTRCGFANDATFFRAFKAIAGMPPKEWLAQQRTPDNA